MVLPANVGTGTLRGSFVDLTGDTADGTVTLRPSVKVLLDASATPPTTIFTEMLTRNIVAGDLADTQVPATDDPDLNPVGWTYEATIKIGAYSRTFHISVPEGGIVDLTTASPVPSTPGSGIVRGLGIPDPSSATDGQVVAWDEPTGQAIWETVSGVTPTSLDSLSDVDTTGVADGQTIVFDTGTSTWGPGDSGAVDSVNGQTGVVSLSAADVGAATATHTHAIADVTNLQTSLDAKADAASLSTVATTGAYADLLNTPTALSDFSGGVAYTQLPKGATITVYYDTGLGAWPARPTASADVTVVWTSETDQGTPSQYVANIDKLEHGV